MFVVCLALEAVSFRFLPDDEERGYELRDAATSVSMGLGNVVVNIGWKLVVLAAFAAAYLVSPIHLPVDNPLTWVALFFAEDLVYYWYHRTHHTVRILWASHVVHHSSQFYNLSTALRQTWTPMTGLPYWLPLAFFVPAVDDPAAAVGEPALPVLPAHRAGRPALAAGRAGDEHARRTTACTTARTRSTSTATTAAS